VRALAIETREGSFVARYTERGLAAIEFPLERATGINVSDKDAKPIILDWHGLVSAAVVSILNAQVPNLLPPLDLADYTEFQRSVWHQLRLIPLGRTLSYGEVARNLGQSGASRAVGAACGANPIPLIIPCHRVLAANKALGGFSAGLNWKQKLLAIEGITVGSTRVRPVRVVDGQKELLFASASASC
jgi:O-6-methylguanine DNA methyltransferase